MLFFDFGNLLFKDLNLVFQQLDIAFADRCDRSDRHVLVGHRAVLLLPSSIISAVEVNPFLELGTARRKVRLAS